MLSEESETIIQIIASGNPTEFEEEILRIYFETRKSPDEIIEIIKGLDDARWETYSLDRIININEFRRKLIQIYFP